MSDAASDCPRCPKCAMPCGTRSGGFTSIAVARQAGPDHLACSACGHVWRATIEDLQQAAFADAAYEIEEQQRRDVVVEEDD